MDLGNSEQATLNEMSSISYMIQSAEKQGLLTEVIWSYGNYRASGVNIDQSAESALYDWDI